MSHKQTPSSRSAFQPFELETYQSIYEHDVEINLADSSVQCVTTREWLNDEEQQRLLDTPLYYPMVNGTLELRRAIAHLYKDARPENVLVTVGAAQANSMVAATLLEPGDEVVVVSPGYRQMWGLAKNAGCTVRELHLCEDNDWRLDLDELDALIGPKTKLVSVVNPNNPTGVVFTGEEMTRIVSACERVGAWLHADEVYCGTERNAVAVSEAKDLPSPVILSEAKDLLSPVILSEAKDLLVTPSFWGRYNRVICTNSLSKAYGLAGARIGWALSDTATIEELWRRHEYAVIAAAAPSMRLAEMALTSEKRAKLIARQREISRAGHALLGEWMAEQGGLFSVRPSVATAIGFVKYELPLTSFEFAERIRKTQSVLVAPGGFMGAEGHLRITLGYSTDKVRRALDRVAAAAQSCMSGM